MAIQKPVDPNDPTYDPNNPDQTPPWTPTVQDPSAGGTPYTPSTPMSPTTPSGGPRNDSAGQQAITNAPPQEPVWTDPNLSLGLGPELGPPTDLPTGGGGLGPELGPPTDGGGGGGSDQGALIAAKLKDLFSQGLTPDINDPALASERLQSQRNFENQRALLAERSGVEGTGQSGGFDTQLLGLGQERGAADLAAVGQAGQNRRNEILNALRLASANQQGNNQLGFNYADLIARLNAQALQSALGGYQ